MIRVCPDWPSLPTYHFFLCSSLCCKSDHTSQTPPAAHVQLKE